MNSGLLIFIILAMLSGGKCYSQNENIELQIKQLDQKNAEVVAKADTLALMQLLSPQFTINRTTGNITSGREKILALMQQGMVSYDSFSVNTEMVVEVVS